MYINKQYKPKELSEVKKNLKSIISVWNEKSDAMEADKALEDWIIISLYQKGFRIIKTGNN